DAGHELRQDALRDGVRLELVRLDECPEPRRVADVAADRSLHEPRQAELREAAIGEIADADDADRRQVARSTLRCVHGRELVDEALRQRVARARTPDDDRRPVADESDRVPDLDDLAALPAAARHGMYPPAFGL